MADEWGDEIPVDLTKVETQDAIPEGEYLVQVSKVETKDSKRTPGNKNLEVEYTVQDGPAHGRKIFETLSLSPKALWKVSEFVNACGVFPGPQGFKKSELLGAFLHVAVKNEQRMQQDQFGNLVPVEGKQRNVVTNHRTK
jgi:hypothetical protein